MGKASRKGFYNGGEGVNKWRKKVKEGWRKHEGREGREGRVTSRLDCLEAHVRHVEKANRPAKELHVVGRMRRKEGRWRKEGRVV
jgi:hypothetical protein